jgi:predicted RNase H-like HicB family nuclease
VTSETGCEAVPTCWDGLCVSEADHATHIEVEQETDGRYLAEVLELPGLLTYGDTRDEAVEQVQALAMRVMAERRQHSGVFAYFQWVSSRTRGRPRINSRASRRKSVETDSGRT